MFLLTRPDSGMIDRFISMAGGSAFSYHEVEATRSSVVPPGLNADHNRVKLGTGPAAFAAATDAVRRWKMFEFDWVRLFSTDTPIETGRTVAILVRHFGFYSLNAARIVYTIDEQIDALKRFGFAYGTLDDHAEAGEERFMVELDTLTGEVWYDLFAISRPRSLLAKIGYPMSRSLQKAFARDSLTAMKNSVRETSHLP